MLCKLDISVKRIVYSKIDKTQTSSTGMSRFQSIPENLNLKSSNQPDQAKLNPKRSLSLRRCRRTNTISYRKYEDDDSGMCSIEDFNCHQNREKIGKKLSFKNSNLIDKKLEMPSLIELSESSKNDINVPCTILIDEWNEPIDKVKSTSNLIDYKGNLLELLVKNQKNLNTNCTIANIATAAAANSDQDASSQGQHFFETLMDLIQPSLPINSQFDLSSTASNDPIEIEHKSFQKIQVELNQIDQNVNSNQKKQVNDQIMVNCLDYLDYVNKKHNHDRNIQIIRNKISGFILLTAVFLIILTLAVLVFYSMTNVIGISDGQFDQSSELINVSTAINAPNYNILKIEIDFFLRNILIRTNATKVNQESLLRLRNNLLDDLQNIFGHEINLTDPNLYFKHAISDFN